MRRQLLVSGVFITVIIAGLWLATQGMPARSYLSVDEVIQSQPSGEISLGARVLSSAKRGGTLRLEVGDESGSAGAVLVLEYSGTQRVSFGPGVTVIARGSLRQDGVFVVTEFVTKGARKAGSTEPFAG